MLFKKLSSLEYTIRIVLVSVLIVSLYSCGSLNNDVNKNDINKNDEIKRGTIEMGIIRYDVPEGRVISKRTLEKDKKEFNYFVAFDENTYVEYRKPNEKDVIEVRYYYSRLDNELYEFSNPNKQGFYTIRTDSRRSPMPITIEKKENLKKINGYECDEIKLFIKNQDKNDELENMKTFYLTDQIPHPSETFASFELYGKGFPLLMISKYRKGEGQSEIGVLNISQELEQDILELNLKGLTFIEEDKFGRYRKY